MTEPEPGGEQEPGAEQPPAWEQTLVDALAFARRRLAGDYTVDEFGFDTDLTESLLLPALRPLYQRWFRVQPIGLHHVPSEGGALVVANHSGTLPLDALMLAVALHDDHPAGRHLRMLAADLVFRAPVIGALARKQGGTLACNPDAERLLAAGELVGVWPEGFKGIGKSFRDRYKLQRFGRGGFVSAALRTGVPIIPCAVVGAEETYPKIGDIRPLARLLGVPYVPVTPTFPLLGPLGLIPLPSKWYIEFGEPIRTGDLGPDAADDPMTVFNLNDQVRETIQHTLYRLLSQRRNPFQG
jgi:1-acyl-sn-glycerol-3-phosphate acyltransferase